LLLNKKLLTIVEKFWVDKKNIYAICAAPLILQKLGILKNIKHTAYLGCEYRPTFLNLNVVQDKNVITGSGPGSTNEFAFKIIENEKGIQIVKNLKKVLKID
jgi:4-methyl-5(b-hydroxyethyl)-thiazole monophosphate biosynthesis